MQVENDLAAAPLDVEQQLVSGLGDSRCNGRLFSGQDHLGDDPMVIGRQFVDAANVFARHDQQVHRRVGMDIFVFWLVFSLHGGTMAGGFSAMIAAALSSMFFPWMFNRRVSK